MLVQLIRDYQLYLLALPAVVYLLIFNYIPMYGVTIAFKDFNAVKGIFGSSWVGFDHFVRFFHSYQFWTLIRNTITISLYQLIGGFPIPIILAILLNQTRNKRFKSFVQTVTYAPHFISIVVLVGMMFMFLSPRAGFVNHIIQAFGGEPILFMGIPEYFKSIYVWSGVWQNTGWASIIYLAALAAISPELYEAAKVDGASKWKQILHIDLPGLMPTAIIIFIMNAGQIMNVGFQKLYLMQTPLTESSQEIISTYIYKIGLINNEYSYSTAINLFNSAINIILLILVNYMSKRVSKTSLW
ncbi:ABC transporter permease subunit [Paenibacillus sp. LMG 31458]|uniref:ABC transporter permease subunit n=2 Tax=Paenibacillus phytorum TaxID=2654977 RepID=A0ABX1Y4U9_9BACL|nr:ABC transporter permease subunit [Paenibacillus phytorum]NOU75489.1 ABC transporter permease subunit [Paenibacillus phytorum]